MYRLQISAVLLSLLLAPESSLAASSLDCSKIRTDGHNFDLSALKGPHSVVTSRWEPNPPAHFNTTYTLDICQVLKNTGKGSDDDKCPNGTRVCAIQHHLKGDQDTITEVISIAGALENHGGSQFDYEATRLKTSDSNSDSKKEGLRLVLKGGKHPLSGDNKKEQKAIIEFLCDKDRTGLEGEWDSEDKYASESKLRVREDEKEEDDKEKEEDGDKEGDKDDGNGESTLEHQLKHNSSALIWDSYKDEKGVDVLRLTWHTKYACESRDSGDDDNGNQDPSAHWGFFTWFVIIVFLGIAAYLIFGSWLNYNRYGARGWDLLPHGDTIRDIPYLMKDWLRRVLNTVQGTGSRGGYSAV